MASDKTIPPGGEGEIKVTLKVNKSRPGVVSKAINVWSNDEANPQVQLRISAEVVATVLTEPKVVDFGKVDVGAGATKEVAVWLREGLKGEITEAKTKSPHLMVHRQAEPDTKGRTVFRVELAKEAPVGFFRSNLKVITSVPKNPQVNVIVQANVLGDYEYEPRTMSLSQQKGKIVFRGRDGRRPLKIVGAESSSEDVSLQIVETKKDKLYEIRVEIAPGAPRLRSKITIKVDNPEQPEITIPLYYGKPVKKGTGKGLRHSFVKPK